MSEQPDVTIAVETDQPELPVQAEAAAVDAAIAANIASERADSATELATGAAEASIQASDQAAVATDVATTAAERAEQAVDAISTIRQELDARDARLLAALEERFGPRKPDNNPTEVVVTNERPANSADSGEGNNSGSSGSSGTGNDGPAHRHRFGRRR